jgi:hypothetical protein
MKRKRSFAQNALFSTVGIVAILVLLVAGFYAGFRQKVAAKLHSRTDSRNSMHAA